MLNCQDFEFTIAGAMGQTQLQMLTTVEMLAICTTLSISTAARIGDNMKLSRQGLDRFMRMDGATRRY